MCRAATRTELFIRLDCGKHRAAPDGGHDEDAGEVLGAAIPVGVSACRRLPGSAKAEVHTDSGEHIAEVVQAIGQQRNAAGKHDDDQLDSAGQEETQGRDDDSPHGAGPVRGVT